MIINFIRHGKTAGNLEKRYIGCTDEPLCEAGFAELKSVDYPECDIVISSPMKRCLQTAEIIYPNIKRTVYDDLRECDFGNFEGRNYIEMSDDPEYAEWIKKGGDAPFPNGEDSQKFRERCISGFLKAIEENRNYKSISFVVHGGTIMSILEKYAVPRKKFYDFMTENGHGFITGFDGEKIEIIGKI
ncbi:MAG: histidine phosphatase family protein [Ruminiclostridium sp.]|nr:histidine phosphatase family protein [Ruminiclostridium sp.]